MPLCDAKWAKLDGVGLLPDSALEVGNNLELHTCHVLDQYAGYVILCRVFRRVAFASHSTSEVRGNDAVACVQKRLYLQRHAH